MKIRWWALCVCACMRSGGVRVCARADDAGMGGGHVGRWQKQLVRGPGWQTHVSFCFNFELSLERLSLE